MGLRLLFSTLCVLSLNAFATDIVTVSSVDLSKYSGRWYQISANPTDFEAGCFCAQQTLTPMQDGRLGVYNSCNMGSITGMLSEIHGVATNDNKETNAQFTIDFGNQRVGQYWVIGLDSEYKWSVVSEPEGKALYILAKTPVLSEADYKAAVAEAAKQVDTTKLVMMTQQDCTYPQVVK